MNPRLTVVLLAVLGAGGLFVGLVVGPGLGPADLPTLFAGTDPLLTGIFVLRLGRTLLGLVVGAALGLAGAALQGLTRNPLADPFLTGVSAGAGTGVALAALVGVGAGFFAGLPVLLGCLGRQLFAFAGGLGAALAVWGLAGRGRASRSGLIVAGVVTNATLSGVILLILAWLPVFSQGAVLAWLLGDLSTPYVEWWPLGFTVVLVVAAGVYLFLRAPALDALALGDTQAHSLGVEMDRTRRGILLAASLATAAATASAGIVPFVGLVAPHLVRVTVGAGHRRLFPLAALVGAVLVLTADNLVRLALVYLRLPSLPLGAALALAGGPFFFHIYRRRGRGELL
jgi:iron complex transport system permease protein